ncbi:MAG: hypothetical protein R2800_14975 [Flavipsychrobacter sp.]
MSILYNSTRIFRQAGGYAGRVGGFFTMHGQQDKVFGISNNHVIANLNNCAQGDIICINNAAKSEVGSLFLWYNLKLHETNTLDAAFFELNNNYQAAWNMPAHIINPTGMRAPMVGENVYMNIYEDAGGGAAMPSRLGRIVQQVAAPLIFSFHGTTVYYQNLYEIHSINYNPFSCSGDSGSLVFSYDHNVIGILIGGKTEEGQECSYISYMAALPVAYFNNVGIRLHTVV